MSRHRQQVRPRYGRITVLGAAALVTLVALLGGAGLLPTSSQQAAATTTAIDHHGAPAAVAGAALAAMQSPPAGTPDAADARISPARDVALPKHTGSGKRVVFSQSRQRVWLVKGKRVERTYLVSGSLYDNLDPGSYEVYSRSEQAYGIDDSGTMKYFVRFTRGDNAAIGFHDIPIDDGDLVQTKAQLGTPLSHGCIRQNRPDAIALWKFAPLGTTVVVKA